MTRHKTLIENEGAIFRGPSRSFPKQVWDRRKQEWSAYNRSVPKPMEWGWEVSEAEAVQFMRP